MSVCTLASCTASVPLLTTDDPRVFVTQDAGVAAERLIVTQKKPIQGSLRIVNTTSEDLPISQTTTWFDFTGLPIRTLLSSPERMVVPRYGDAYIKLISPSPSAVDFNVRIERAF